MDEPKPIIGRSPPIEPTPLGEYKPGFTAPFKPQISEPIIDGDLEFIANPEVVGLSPNKYIAFRSKTIDVKGASRIIEKSDVVNIGNVVVFCRSADDAIKAHKGELQHGQDAASVVLLGNGQIIFSQADGVGATYMSDIASKLVTRAIVTNPNINLRESLIRATRELTRVDLPDPNTGVIMTDEALKETRNKVGSETTLNQYVVNENTGEVDGLFKGDGGFTILRNNGTREHFSCGSHTERLSTKLGERGGQAKTLTEVAGKKIKLNPGDTLLAYSDVGQHEIDGKLLIDDICDVIVQGGEANETSLLLEDKSVKDLSPDDTTLIKYTQPLKKA